MKFVKTILAVALVAAIAGIAPQAHATAVNQQLFIAGSSALWQSMSIAAYNNGTNINKTPINAAYTSTCHWTTGATSAGQAQSFTLEDTRIGGNVKDSGGTWVVWSVLHTTGNTAPQDCTAAANGTAAYSVADFWVFANVDSVVGNHSYFAKSEIYSGYASGSSPIAGANAIAANLYGGVTTGDDPMPQDLWNQLTLQTNIVNVAATDIRPEDAAWVMCRANSPLGSSVASGGAGDALDGLGYNTTGAAQGSGACAVYNSSTTQALKNVFGNPVLSGSPENSGKKANVAAFNIVGKDPATNSAVPAYTVYPVGAAPIVFIKNQANGTLTNLTNATDQQLQQVFSGTNCNASAFGLTAGALNVVLREPLSGTYNTTESNVMRYPTTYPSAPGVIGLSMETGVGTNNPLGGTTFHGTACAGGGGLRYRAIGTGEEVNTVRDSNTSKFNTQGDSVGFTFYSYGNVSNIAGNTSYGYVQLNGEDPIFESYYPGKNGSYIDPGQPGGGVLPLNTPCGSGLAAFPCSEQQIWGNGLSFPNVRKGHYRAYSLLRLVATSTAGTYAGDLVAAAQLYAVQEVPDFIPAKEVKCPTGATTCTPATILDPGLVLVRSHYLQHDGSGAGLGYGCATTCHIPENYPTEYQSDMGGVIIPTNQGGLVTPTTLGGTCKSLLVNSVTSTFCNGTGVYEINNVQGSSTDDGRGGFVRPNDN